MIAETAAIAPAAATRPDRAGIVAVVPDQQTLDRIRGILQDLQIGDELQPEATFDASAAPDARGRRAARPAGRSVRFADPVRRAQRNARTVAGEALKIVALGTVNDVGLYRDLIGAGASDYLVKPVSREALAAALERDGGATGAAAGAGSDRSSPLSAAAAESGRRPRRSPAPGSSRSSTKHRRCCSTSICISARSR